MSSAALSISQDLARSQARADLVTEITRARKQRNGRLWGAALGTSLLVGLLLAWFSRRGSAVSPSAAAPGAPVTVSVIPSPAPLVVTAPVPVLAAPTSASSDAAVQTSPVHPVSRAVPIQQLPQLPAGAPVQTPMRNGGTRRTKPAGQPSGTPTIEDIPRNPYR